MHQFNSLNTAQVSWLVRWYRCRVKFLKIVKLLKAGFGKSYLLPISITVKTANKIPINILGAFRATISVILELLLVLQRIK